MPARPHTPSEPSLPGRLDAAGEAAAYRALCARDARFDGRLFVGVTSTGIYCRPVCRVRTPLQRHCRFYQHAAAAERDGFRPCLRCRPELAPGLSRMDTPGTLADEAARRLREAVLHGEVPDMPALAARLGVTDRHLRRIFLRQFGVTPVAYLGTQRLLWAKQLLTDTRWPVQDVALASGFRSVRRFHAAFAAHYRLQPLQLRRQALPEHPASSIRQPSRRSTGTATCGAADRPSPLDPSPAATRSQAITLQLAFRPPLDAPALLRFLARRALPGVERVDEAGLALRRTWRVRQAGQTFDGWIAWRIDLQRHRVHVQVATSLAPVLGTVVSTVRRWLDLDADPQAIEPVLQAVQARAGLPARSGLRLPVGPDGFEAAVRTLLGQQVTVAAARTLVQRLVTRYGTPADTPHAGLDRLFPEPQALALADPDELGRLGLVRQRSAALQALARAVHAGELQLDPQAPIASTQAALQALPGVGPWTVQVISLRALGWPDAWPASDVALHRALGLGRDVPTARATRETDALSQAWRPWRSYAVMRLWQHLEDPSEITP